MCISYTATIKLIEKVSQLYTVPLKQWIADDIIFKFWGDNLDQKRGVRDVCFDHQGSMVHMYSMLVGRSRTPAIALPRAGQVACLDAIPSGNFLPSASDIQAVKHNLVVIISRLLTRYIHHLSPLSKSVPKHIRHAYSEQMSRKSEVVVLDV